jgi:LPXTG-site transpeptidase (sortase) family protein
MGRIPVSPASQNKLEDLIYQQVPIPELFKNEYARLQSLPPKKQRSLRKHWKRSLASIALILAMGGSMLAVQAAKAATISVTAGAAGINSGDGCSLVEAIINANNDAQTHAECTKGNGADTIYLAGNTYNYTTAFGSLSALPDIASNITIEGNGGTIQRDSAAGTNFRIIRVDSAGDLTLNEATITGGKAGFEGGGGIFNYGGTVSIKNSTINENSARNGGGIQNIVSVYGGTYSATLTVENSTISGNTASSNGGGVSNESETYNSGSATATATINDSTITGNSASNGGGLFSDEEISGGGSPSSTTILNRSIISGNTGIAGQEVYNEDGIIYANNFNLFGRQSLTNAQAFSNFAPGANDITATSDGTSPTYLSDILDPLADNDGPTKTHALVAGSPAIDAIATGPATDQRGAPRPTGSGYDIGSFEFGSVVPVASVGGNGAPEVMVALEDQDKICPLGSPGVICKEGPFKVVAAANTVTDEQSCYIVIDEAAAGNFKLDGRVFDAKVICDGIEKTSFNPALKVCFNPSNAQLQAAGWDFNNLVMHHNHANGGWNPLLNTFVEDRYLCAQLDRLSLFTITVPQVPATGFAPGVVTALDVQPASKAYAVLEEFRLEIPSLGVHMPIVGVPLSPGGWDVSWLGESVGYLTGTAYPTWAGNTALTAHVWNADNTPGPFVDLHTLQHGDQIIIEAWGQKYVYEVRSSQEVRPNDLSFMSHSDFDVLTLITCQRFDEISGEYDRRLVVQAVLINISD